ncbi:MAG: NAD(P)H-hydrate dehydratase [Acidimicrobiales bacterium]|nr:NAD(P)H-hydrate dehydratase [Acidimicrobiales bacterium]
MIVGLGVDVVDLERFGAVLARRPGVAERLFTDAERAYAEQGRDPVERLAVRFAAKEAALKALGVGIGPAGWHDVEVVRGDAGRPSLVLRGGAAERAEALGVTAVEVTLTHGDLVAAAVVVAERAPDPGRGVPGPGAAAGRPPAPVDLGVGLPTAGGLVPIVTPAEMGAVDAAAPEPVDVLIGRAGGAVARAAISMMGGGYGRRVVILEGKGNNGNDGREAARRLRRLGVRVVELDVAEAPAQLPPADLVVDAAFGTGFRGEFAAPTVDPDTPVLAVDIPSGVDGLTGEPSERVLAATATVTFAALKPGLVVAPGVDLAGQVVVADIGLDVSGATAHLVGGAAVAGWLADTVPAAHKWRSAVWIVAGSPGMSGAAALCAAAAARSGAGYVRLSTPGGLPRGAPVEAVLTDLPGEGWASAVVGDLDRFRALVVGNGLGTAAGTIDEVRRLVAAAAERGLPTVVDADGITALGRDAAGVVGPTTVLTPHDGEFARLAGAPPGPDRVEAARRLASDVGAVVLLKGRATVVAAPDGEVLVSTTGDRRLATAGTGDVLAGVIGALLAQGLPPLRAAAAGAFLHGRAGALGWPRGLVAGDLPGAVPAALAEVTALGT